MGTCGLNTMTGILLRREFGERLHREEDCVKTEIGVILSKTKENLEPPQCRSEEIFFPSTFGGNMPY